MSNMHPGDPGVESIAALAVSGVNRSETHDPTVNADALRTFVTRDDERLVVKSFESYLPAPRRPRGTYDVTDTASFVRLVSRLTANWSSPESVAVFADVSRYSVTAVLNFDEWRDLRVELALQSTPLWLHWYRADGKLLTQQAFAEHLQDGRLAIVEPSAADMVGIARTFKAKRNVTFEAGVHTQSGDVKFEYTEDTRATAGVRGAIEIPERITLQMPVFEGGAIMKAEGDFKYSAGREGLGLGYRLDNPKQVIRAAFDSVLESLAADLGEGYLMLQGTATPPCAPLD